MMHFNMRFMPVGATLKPLMEAGSLGEIYHVTTTYTRRDGYPRPGGWFGQKDKSGGGPLIDLGVHRLDLALWLIGYPKPVAASGNVYDLLARRKLKGLDFDCEDFCAAMVRFENGCTMYLTASWDGHQKSGTEQTMSIYGTDGSIFEREGQLALCRKEHGVSTVSALELMQPKESAQQHFVNCVLEGRKPGPSAEHGVIVMKILDAVYESARTGREARIR
jgi:predicted dehydrogenase